jgi:1-acyl-sn-glycerol-3-phosphate acyltransferase
LILRAKHNFIVSPFFIWHTGRLIKRAFKPIRIIGDFNERNLPILLISNHVSWWDGFWIVYLNRKIFKRSFYFMMLEEQLRKFWFFNYAGGFSVKKGSKSIIESIHYSLELLSNSQNLVFMFPQGEIQSMHKQTFAFEKGIEKILKNKGKKVQIIFQVNLIDYFSNAKPGLNIYFTEYHDEIFDIKSMENKFNVFYEQCIDKQINNAK